MTTPDIPEDISERAEEIYVAMERVQNFPCRALRVIEEALLSERNRERERWQAAATYFERYCQDEAEDDAVEWVGCSEQQHLDAKAFAASIRGTE